MKRNIIHILLASAVAFGVSSCNNRLNIDPYQQIDAEQAFETDADIQSAVIGAYAVLGSGSLYGTNLIMLPDLLAGENYLNWSGTFLSFREVRNKNISRTNEEARRTWVSAYEAINICNSVIANADKIKNANLKSTLRGEALLLRAMMFFELTRLYGKPIQAGESSLGIPLVLTPSSEIKDLDAKPARNTVGECYAQIIKDLNEAVGLLPDDNGNRGDKYTALGFLARVYLQKDDYQNAYNAATQIIESGKYGLAATVTSVFRNKNTTESLYEVQQNLQNNAGTSNDGLVTFFAGFPVADYNTSLGYDGFTNTIGRRDAHVNENFYNLYDLNDKRRNELFYWGRTSRMYTGKYVDFGQNFVVLRYSEILLIQSEAAFKLGKMEDAVIALNAVRERAGISLFTEEDISLEAIQKERYLELAYEGVRIHDLKRWKQNTGDFAWDSPKMVFPIPQREMEINPSLVQNEGY